MSEKKFDTSYAARELLGVGLDPEIVIPAWEVSSVNEGVVNKSLEVLRAIEKAESGAAQLLSKEFGIRNFGRYSAEVLLKQLEQRSNKEDEYVLWVNPLADENGEFFRFSNQINIFARSLGKANLRIVESEAVCFIQTLQTVRQRYSPITTAVWGGHGHPNGIVMDQDGEINTDTLKTEGAAIKNAFASNPSIALVSCSTGADGGFAQELSSLLQGKVQAPRYRTSLEIIKAIPEGGRTDLKISYIDEVVSRYGRAPLKGDKAVYERGRLIA